MEQLDRLRLNMFGELQDVPQLTIKISHRVKPVDMPKVGHSQDSNKILQHLMRDHIETFEGFWVLFLNRANKVIGCYQASQGGVSGTVADPKMIYGTALTVKDIMGKAARGLCSGIIVAHNHPSGNLLPSQADIDLTKKLKQAGQALEIQVLDHMILTPEGKYYSFADEGLM